MSTPSLKKGCMSLVRDTNLVQFHKNQVEKNQCRMEACEFYDWKLAGEQIEFFAA
jgi:hypothetical protein